MKAKELKEKFVVEGQRDKVGVIAISSFGVWWHIHDEEELPAIEDIAIHIRKQNGGI